MAHFINRRQIDDLLAVDASGDLLLQMQVFFETLVPERLHGAHQALNEGNIKGLKGKLHALKNSFLNVGALGVGDECQNIEDRVDGLDAQGIRLQLAELERRYELVKLELKSLIQSMDIQSLNT